LDFSLGKLELFTNESGKIETGIMHYTVTEMNQMHIKPANLEASGHKISLEGANALLYLALT